MELRQCGQVYEKANIIYVLSDEVSIKSLSLLSLNAIL